LEADIPECVFEILVELDAYLLCNSSLVGHSIGFADVFMLCMFRRGELGVTSGEALTQKVKVSFPNVCRHLDHLLGAYNVGKEKLFIQEERMFSTVHHLTSSAQFLQAIIKRDLVLAKKLTLTNPMAVRATE